MRAIILDMYGVILKEPGDSFFAFVQQTYPELSQKEIYNCWNLGAAQALGLSPILFNRRNADYQGECVYSFRELEDKIKFVQRKVFDQGTCFINDNVGL